MKEPVKAKAHPYIHCSNCEEEAYTCSNCDTNRNWIQMSTEVKK